MIKTETIVGVFDTSVGLTSIATPDGRGKTNVNPGVPASFSSRALTADDNGLNLICASAQSAVIPAGLPLGFGCSFKGTVSFSGTATINDIRTTGAANPWCSVVCIAADAYDIVGGKA